MVVGQEIAICPAIKIAFARYFLAKSRLYPDTYRLNKHARETYFGKSQQFTRLKKRQPLGKIPRIRHSSEVAVKSQ